MIANDKKVWKAACRELLALGVTDIHTDPTLDCEPGHNLYFAAQYGTTPVVVQYNRLRGLLGGEVLMGFTAHGRCILEIKPIWTVPDSAHPYRMADLELESTFYLLK